MHWTTAVPVALSVLHAAIVHDETSALHAARIFALGVAMEVLSNCDLHGVSILLATPTIAALSVGTVFETLHALQTATETPEQAAARERWDAAQRRQLTDDLRALIELRAAARRVRAHVQPALEHAPVQAL